MDVKDILAILERHINDLDNLIAEEKLSGNVVKEAHAQGGRAELIALESIIGAVESPGDKEKSECYDALKLENGQMICKCCGTAIGITD